MATAIPGENFLAIDLGAESGRAILGRREGERLGLEEVHRFPNGPVRVLGHLHWDVLRLWSEIQHGLRLAAGAAGSGLASLGLDTWGVDFALLDGAGNLIGNPYHYRDSRTDGMLEAAFARLPSQEIYRQTRIQFMQINSLYQLYSLRLAGDPALERAETLLMMPDLFNYWLSGRKANEFTCATTSQCYNPTRSDWAWEVLDALEIPRRLFQPIVQPGEVLAGLRAEMAQDTGAGELPVVAVGSHDTASAVAAVPAQSERIVFISSGTWSLLGSEVTRPVISEQSLAFNFTNEGGIGGGYRFLKNISGMWLLQECRRAWAAAGREYSYAELTRLAAEAPPFRSLVDHGAPDFMQPGGMPERIRRYCLARGQPAPITAGEYARCALESLALAYRRAISQLEQALGYRLEAVHIVGGGSQNRLLNQFTADATGLPVIAGPVEATAIGNVLVQAMAVGRLATLAEARQVVRRSFPVEVFEPGPSAAWDEAYGRWLELS
jgi:rhamnulokinase